MNIFVSGKGFQLNSRLRDEVSEHLAASLQCFDSRISDVRAFLADDNGPKKGIDRSIQLVVSIEHLPKFVVKEKGSDWESTLVRVSDRIVHCIDRRIKRLRSTTGARSLSIAMATDS